MTKWTIPNGITIVSGSISADKLDAGTYSAGTNRPGSPELEQILGQEFKVLDHGFVRCVDFMGNDAAVTQAARVSYGTGTKTVNEDRGLIRYLMSHYHSTPFEMAEIKLHVKLPVFVARQWVRHRMANINEYSARYSVLDKEFYFPEAEQMKLQSTTNNQGRGEHVDGNTAQRMFEIIEGASEEAYRDYENLNNWGLARELSRMVLPVNVYTQWYWKVDAHNLMNFLRLRADPHAQYEIRVYAEKILDIFKIWMPHTYEAFIDYRMEAKSFSRMEMEILVDELARLRAIVADGGICEDEITKFPGLSDREITEFLAKLKGPSA
jgi:thymidylate synthase (FAD)